MLVTIIPPTDQHYHYHLDGDDDDIDDDVIDDDVIDDDDEYHYEMDKCEIIYKKGSNSPAYICLDDSTLIM